MEGRAASGFPTVWGQHRAPAPYGAQPARAAAERVQTPSPTRACEHRAIRGLVGLFPFSRPHALRPHKPLVSRGFLPHEMAPGWPHGWHLLLPVALPITGQGPANCVCPEGDLFEGLVSRLRHREEREENVSPTVSDIRIEPSDVEVLKALDVFGVMTWNQLKHHIFRSDRTTSRRTGKLVEQGLINCDRSLENIYGKLYTLTPKGARSIESPRTPYTVAGIVNHTHALAMVDVLMPWIYASWGVLTEREITFADKGGDPLLGAALLQETKLVNRSYRRWIEPENRRPHYLSVPVKNRPHIPDAIVISSTETIAIELEITLKSDTRFEEVIKGYCDPRSPFDRVLWVASPEVEQRLIGPRGLLWETAWGHRIADRNDPRTTTLKWPLSEDRSGDTRGVNCVWKFKPIDEGVRYAFERSKNPRLSGVSRAQWRRLQQEQQPF